MTLLFITMGLILAGIICLGFVFSERISTPSRWLYFIIGILFFIGAYSLANSHAFQEETKTVQEANRIEEERKRNENSPRLVNKVADCEIWEFYMNNTYHLLAKCSHADASVESPQGKHRETILSTTP